MLRRILLPGSNATTVRSAVGEKSVLSYAIVDCAIHLLALMTSIGFYKPASCMIVEFTLPLLTLFFRGPYCLCGGKFGRGR